MSFLPVSRILLLKAVLVSASVFAFVVPSPIVYAKTVVSGTITSNRVWTKAGSPYLVTDNLKINTGVTLTIEPGVVVKVSENLAMPWLNNNMDVYGRLNASGTDSEKIYFTSVYDDSLGGDTNGDGDATAPSEFDSWRIRFFSGSQNSVLAHVVIRYTADGPFFSSTEAGIDHLRMDASGNGISAIGSVLDITNSDLSGLLQSALSVNFGSTVTMSDSRITNVLYQPVIVSNNSRLSLYNSEVLDTGLDYAISVALNSTLGIASSTIDGGIDSGIGIFYTSTAYISSSTIRNFLDGVIRVVDGSKLIIATSSIQSNTNGITLLNRCEECSGTFKEKRRSYLTARNNSLVENISFGVLHESPTNSSDARGNWWGDPSGPYHVGLNPGGLGDAVSDNVDFSEWLVKDPFAPEVTCCSSVAFIPGLEASRLYRQGALLEDKLWEPNNNHDVAQLGLSPVTGGSVDPLIYTRDVLDEPLGLPIAGNIYKGFLAYMNGLATDGTINAFEPLPYDWRMDVRDVATRDIALESGSSYTMVSHIEALAGASETGKVTLITHSNGGLVAKELINELVRLGKATLVDRVIMVAAPELGTPDAVLALLHGAKFFLGLPSREATRELGENMKSGYALLPSRKYFTRLGEFPPIRPIIEFATTTPVTRGFRSIYGDSISDYNKLRQFLLGDNGSRSEPTASDVNTPNVLKEHFLTNAEAYHGATDVWTPPVGVEVIEIIGWGLATPYGIRYEAVRKRVCNENNSVC